MLLIVAIILVFALGSPWGVVAFGVCLILFLGELTLWSRTVRRRGVQSGAATLIGATATVATACRPDGQVRVGGEIWKARCAAGADLGDRVVVTALDNLTLVVERTDAT